MKLYQNNLNSPQVKTEQLMCQTEEATWKRRAVMRDGLRGWLVSANGGAEGRSHSLSLTNHLTVTHNKVDRGDKRNAQMNNESGWPNQQKNKVKTYSFPPYSSLLKKQDGGVELCTIRRGAHVISSRFSHLINLAVSSSYRSVRTPSHDGMRKRRGTTCADGSRWVRRRCELWIEVFSC